MKINKNKFIKEFVEAGEKQIVNEVILRTENESHGFYGNVDTKVYQEQEWRKAFAKVLDIITKTISIDERKAEKLTQEFLDSGYGRHVADQWPDTSMLNRDVKSFLKDIKLLNTLSKSFPKI